MYCEDIIGCYLREKDKNQINSVSKKDCNEIELIKVIFTHLFIHYYFVHLFFRI